MKLLIVDDSTIIRRKILRTQNVVPIKEIFQAEDGQQAIEMATKVNPTVITMDLTMPHVDGIDAIKKIRAAGVASKILVISALTDKQTALQAIKIGASGFLPKPFSDKQLNVALDQVIQL